MKDIAKFVKVTLILTLFLGWGLTAMAQSPPPPPENHNLQGNQEGKDGGEAPIGSGIVLLLGLGAAWGGKKVYQAYKEEGSKK